MKKIKSITIIGTWRKSEARQFKTWAEKIGALAAKNNLKLLSGAGTGASELVVNAYRQSGGKKYTAYLVAAKYMKVVGEEIGPRPDKIIQTKLDYPGRNLLLAQNTELAIVLSGGLGTLEEIIFNAKDYRHPVIVIANSPIAKMVKALPDLKKYVKIAKDFSSFEKYILQIL